MTATLTAQTATERQCHRDPRPTTFFLSDLEAHCDRWNLPAESCYFSIEDVIYLHFCSHGEEITEEMLKAECMDIRKVADANGKDLPLGKFIDVLEFEDKIEPDAMYELRYIADYA